MVVHVIHSLTSYLCLTSYLQYLISIYNTIVILVITLDTNSVCPLLHSQMKNARTNISVLKF